MSIKERKIKGAMPELTDQPKAHSDILIPVNLETDDLSIILYPDSH